MKRFFLIIVFVLVSSVSFVFADPLWEQTEVLRLSEQIKQQVDKAKTQVKPHLDAERKAQNQLSGLMKKYKDANSDNERMLVSSQMEISAAKAIREGKNALDKLIEPLDTINSSLVDLYTILVKANLKGRDIDDKTAKEIIQKTDEINRLSKISAQVALKYVTDPAVQSKINRVIRSVDINTASLGGVEARVRNVRNVARRRITDALALANEIRGLRESFRQEGLWRQFITQLRLLNAMLLKTGGELSFNQGNSFAPVITQLRDQVGLLREYRELDKDILEREDKYVQEGSGPSSSDDVVTELQNYRQQGIQGGVK